MALRHDPNALLLLNNLYNPERSPLRPAPGYHGELQAPGINLPPGNYMVDPNINEVLLGLDVEENVMQRINLPGVSSQYPAEGYQ